MCKYSYVRGKKQSYEHPAHKRRFPRFASRNNINYYDFISNKKNSDVYILSPASDITYWKRKKKTQKCKIIFDANDPFLLSQNLTIKDNLRGFYKYISGNHKYLEFNYRKSYLDICKISDLVVVGHKNQYDLFKRKSINVCLIPDYGIEIDIKKKDNFTLSKNKTINIFWEGLGSSFMPFKLIEKIFSPINKKFNFIFHFVTDLNFYKYGDQYFKKNITDIAKNDSPKFYEQFRFYQWSEYMMNKIAISCDFAIIPLPEDNSLNFWKPENKLIHMWRMGMPTITSKIPSYIRVMEECNQNLITNDFEKWRNHIISLSQTESLRKCYGNKGFDFVKKNYSDQIIDNLWHKHLSKI